MASAPQVNASKTLEVSSPSVADMGREPQVFPQVEELVDVDETSDVVVGTLAQHDLIHLSALTPLGQVPLQPWATPADMGRQLDDTGRLLKARVVDIVG